MSRDGSAEHGVTTHLGEVLTGHRKEYHEGLVCVDASVIPLALGVNPFATITALAERSVEGVAKKRGIQIDYDTKNGMHWQRVCHSVMIFYLLTPIRVQEPWICLANQRTPSHKTRI